MRIPSLFRALPAVLAFCFVQAVPVAALAQANQDTSLASLAALGQRVQSIRVSIKDSPDVVIVPDARSFAEALGAWTLTARFPILIDDGTFEAQERIGRFVRAYKPERVVRWTAPKAEPMTVRERYERAMARSWAQTDRASLHELWRTSGFSPLGVVVVSERDPSWVGGLALASGRGQLTAWSTLASGRVGGVMRDEELVSLDATISSALKEGGWSWDRLGDAVDAVTLAMDLPTKFRVGEQTMAVTDRIGRHASGRRFAYTGMIFGNASASAYSAICALFLQPQSSLFFDGYDQKFAPPYKLAGASETSNRFGWRTTLISAPANTPDSWRNAARSGVDAGFIHVNTSGRFDRFDVARGSLYGHDVPLLRVPSIVHFIHSFSAQRLSAKRNIAGRFIDQGAYIYVGSVDEPFITAFVPADRLLRRAAASMPLGGASRTEQRKTVWKINYFGDPLMVIGKPAPRTDEPVPLEGVGTLDTELQSALQERDLVCAARTLIMLGRDSTAAQLAKAKAQQVRAKNEANEGSASIGEGLARAALAAAFRAGDPELVFDLAEQLIAAGSMTDMDIDLLWNAARPTLGSIKRPEIVLALRENIRDASPVEDATDLAPTVARIFGRSIAREMIDSVMLSVRRDKDREALNQLSRRYRAPRAP